MAPSRLASVDDSSGAAEVRARMADMTANMGMTDVDNILDRIAFKNYWSCPCLR